MISLTRKTFLRVITVLMLTLLFVTASAYASESLVVYSPLHEEENCSNSRQVFSRNWN